ncbi:MAG: type II toxin-antitoxin system HicB family antitoxin [Pseudomonadota bacterium]|nr:type II toxin-antitoxin system HicB family antitoxin [Pseudomonadota bacterium]
METQNFTLRLPKELIRKAKVLAAQRGTSVAAW